MMRAISKVFFWVVVVTLINCKADKSKPIVESESEVKKTTVPKDTTHNISYIMGHFDPESHPLFSKIESQYADRDGMYMRTEAYDSFIKMWTSAASDGISLVIRSAARNFNYQRRIWERKWTGATQLSDGTMASDIEDEEERALKILLYSSMPGTSRHHWGTDIDLNSFDNEWFEKGEGLKVYNWLLTHAESYGFCQVYTAKGTHRPHGYEEEKWHWSYKPLSEPLTAYAENHLQNTMIQNFKGASVSSGIDVVRKYVLGIDPMCRE